MKLLGNLSIGKYGNRPIPVVVARLIHDVGYAFEDEHFSREFGVFIGEVIYNLLGVDLTDDAIKALEKFKRSEYVNLFKENDISTFENGLHPGVKTRF